MMASTVRTSACTEPRSPMTSFPPTFNSPPTLHSISIESVMSNFPSSLASPPMTVRRADKDDWLPLPWSSEGSCFGAGELVRLNIVFSSFSAGPMGTLLYGTPVCRRSPSVAGKHTEDETDDPRKSVDWGCKFHALCLDAPVGCNSPRRGGASVVQFHADGTLT